MRPYFASEFTQTKLMVHGHRHDDENCIGRSGGNMTMDLVIASGGTAMVRKSLSECLVKKFRVLLVNLLLQ